MIEKLSIACDSIPTNMFPFSSILKAITGLNGDELVKRRFRHRFPLESDLKKFVEQAGEIKVTRAEEARFNYLLEEIRNFDAKMFQRFYNELYHVMLNLLRLASLKGVYAQLNVIVCFKHRRKKSKFVGYLVQTPPYGILVDKGCVDWWILVIAGDRERDERLIGISEQYFNENLLRKSILINKFCIYQFAIVICVIFQSV
jgi:hypothetical protein